MRSVSEVSRLTGVSIRTLHYYDAIGLLHPTQKEEESGYRLYDDTALERLQSILLFRELQFPLKEIRKILDSPGFDKRRALDQQITLLEMKREHLDNLIDLARGIRMIGGKKLMDFTAFDTGKIDEYAAQAKEAWGKTEAYREFEEKSRDWTEEDQQQISQDFMEIFIEFGKLRNEKASDGSVQKQVEKLRRYITEHFYTCTTQILSSLGQMYAGGGSMTENIDRAGGEGTAEFAAEAIEVYCSNAR